MKTLSIVLALSLGCLISSGVSSPALAVQNVNNQKAPAQSLLEQANRLYASHQYPAALSLVNSMLPNNASNPDVHYLRAVLLTAIGQDSAADQEYRTTLQLQPSAQVRQYCMRALTGIDRSMASIEAQAASQARSAQVEAAEAAATFNNDAAAFGDYEQAHAAQVMAAMSSVSRHGAASAAYSAAEIQSVGDAANRRSARVANAAAMSANSWQYLAQSKTQAAAESAQNLQALLAEPESAGSPHLSSLGTNYFVRNYGDSQPTPVTTPVAQIAKAGALPNSLRANPGSLPAMRSPAGEIRTAAKNTATVTGKIISQVR